MRTKRKTYPIKDHPVMKARCKTCPFGEEGNLDVKHNVESRLLEALQMCHGTGWPKGTHLCRGARDWQLQVFYRLGVITEPTDEAWDAKRRELDDVDNKA